MFEIILIITFVFISGAFYIDNRNLRRRDKELNSQFQTVVKEMETQVENNKKIVSQKKSSEVTTGLILEQVAPFLAKFKYNPRESVFLGKPIDYIVFGENEIIFMDIKTGSASLSPKQKNIQKLIDEKKVRWETVRFDGKPNLQITNDEQST